ncbi:hypothetical protein [Paraburkholderia acidisoli]|uniref:Uncharacterized protein n=1 Tax=Paraburkholderia acidisoli TaxID=2571748 RepID=A0A7Z2GKA4_9BURK|nr:hypothetical protein [Paraburkholderia acidisoli]QGZ63283.1 hypothetical protein FAZ98_15885 [Paraburkholderia acidisoli]
MSACIERNLADYVAFCDALYLMPIYTPQQHMLSIKYKSTTNAISMDEAKPGARLVTCARRMAYRRNRKPGGKDAEKKAPKEALKARKRRVR